jgi:hypothetical protein
LPKFEQKRGIEVMRMAFASDFAGDRVAALIAGMGGMIQTGMGGPQRTFHHGRTRSAGTVELRAQPRDHRLETGSVDGRIGRCCCCRMKSAPTAPGI